MYIRKDPVVFSTENLTQKELSSLLPIIQNYIENTYKKGLLLSENNNPNDINNSINNSINNKQTHINNMMSQNQKNQLKCPKCGDIKLNKNGKMNNRQRYICKNCRTTFDERSFSPLSNTKLSLEKWLNYCRFMIEGGTLKYCAQNVGVSIPTSFFMRHKILDMLNLCLRNQTFEGIVYNDEYNLNESFKGKSYKKSIEEERYFYNFNHDNIYSCVGLIYRNSFRSIKHPENYLNLIQVKINTAIDKKGHVLTRIIENPYFMPYSKEIYQDLFAFFNKKVDKNVTLCAFRGASYRQVAFKLNLKFKQAPSRLSKSAYSINHVFMYNRKLSEWLRHFNGVATKYLNNYLSWYAFLYMLQNTKENLKTIHKIKNLFLKFATTDLSITKYEIQNRKIESISL